MERHLDTELQRLNSELLRMATLTETAIHRSVEAIKDRNVELAEQVIQDDVQIDELEIAIEEMTVEMLALFQPMAKDLRFITTGIRINSELEEMADLMVNVCIRIKEIVDKPVLKPLNDIPKLGEKAKWMVRSAIDAFVTRDKELAKKVILFDKEVNALRTDIMKELVYKNMVEDGSTAPTAVSLLLIARDIERFCDHAASIAEDVIYMIQAKVIRHHRERLTSLEEDK